MINVIFFLWILGMTVMLMLLFHSKYLDDKLIKNKIVLRAFKCMSLMSIIGVIYVGMNYFFTHLIYKI